MARILTIITLVIMFALFPPSVLALVSNNAVPGDVTYPVKRWLEDRVVSITSFHPTSKAWFSAARSDRRFEEARVLITRGKEAGNSLNELIQQTETAAGQIQAVSDETQKQKLALQLTESIEKYDKGLEALSTGSTPRSLPSPMPSSSPSIAPSAMPSANPTVVLTPKPSSTPTPVPSVLPSTQPVTPTVTPSVTSSPTPTPRNEEDEKRKREIEEARKKLEEIKKRLEEEAKARQQKREERQDRKEEKREDRKDDKTNKNRDS